MAIFVWTTPSKTDYFTYLGMRAEKPHHTKSNIIYCAHACTVLDLFPCSKNDYMYMCNGDISVYNVHAYVTWKWKYILPSLGWGHLSPPFLPRHTFSKWTPVLLGISSHACCGCTCIHRLPMPSTLEQNTQKLLTPHSLMIQDGKSKSFVCVYNSNKL